MANVFFAGKALVAGAVCSLFLVGCTGGASPVAPTASFAPASATLSPLARTAGPVQAASLRKKSDDRFITCFPDDGSFLQISVEAIGGVNEAVQYCHKVLNGKTGGVEKAPAPEVP